MQPLRRTGRHALALLGLCLGLACILDNPAFDGLSASVSTSHASDMGESEPTISSSTGSTGVIPLDWWDPAWHRRRPLIVDNPTATTLVNAPLLLKLDADRIDYANTSPGGDDLRLLPAGGSPLPLPLELESWATGDDSWLWVQLPTVPPGASEYWLYWDNPDAPPPSAATLWSKSYAAVYHLADRLDDDARLIRDANGEHNGHAFETMNQSSADVGPVGPALRFMGPDSDDGVGGDFFVNDAAPLETDAWNGLTIEAWVRHSHDGEHRIVCKSPSTVPEEHVFALGTHSDGAEDPTSVYLRLGVDDANAVQFETAPGTLEFGANAPWRHLAATWDGLTVRLFVDGLEVPIRVASTDAERTEGVEHPGMTLRDDPNAVTIANVNNKLASQNEARFWRGLIDELRLSRKAHSPDWLRFQVMSMRDEVIEYGATQQLDLGP